MARTLALLSVLTLSSLPTWAQVPQAPASDPIEMMNAFSAAESEMLASDRRFRLAPSGSSQEDQANRQRRAAGYQALMAIADVQSLALQDSSSAESFALSLNRKFSLAPTGSYVESVYKQAREYAVWAFAEASHREIQTAGWSEAVNRTLALARKYSLAPTGSAMEDAYRRLVEFGASSARYQFDIELRQGQTSTSDAENMGLNFQRSYSLAPTGSRVESMYAALRDLAFRSALNTLNVDVQSFSLEDLRSLYSNYDRRYRLAPTGSSAEQYYGQARDLVRAEIARR